MKKLLLERGLGLCLMLAVFTNGAWASTDSGTTFEELALGDWFVLKQTKPSDRVDEEFSTTWKGTVINRTEQELTVEFVLTHFFQLKPNDEGYKTHSYIDSYFPYEERPEKNKISSNPPKITMTRSLFADGCLIIDIKLSDTIRNYELEDYLYGLKNTRKGYARSWGSGELSISEMAEQIKSFLIQDKLVSLANLNLVQASFKLMPNTMIYYKLDGYKQKTPPEINKDDDYDYSAYLKKENSDAYSIVLHLDRPTKMWIEGGCNLWLSPGDSLVITKNKIGELSFSGKGAEICEIASEIGTYTREINNQLNYAYYDPKKIENCIGEIENIYEEKLYPNKSKIDPYWYQSARLSLYYIESTTLLGKNTLKNPKKIDDWGVAPFDSICPIIDYRYQPEFYHRFVKAFYRYNCQVLNNNNLTDNMYWGQDRKTFYLIEQLFKGYLRSYMWFENLEQRLQGEYLSSIKEEMSVFYKYCFEPELKSKVKKLERHYAKLENGQNIQELDIDFIKQLPLEKKSDGYVFLNVSTFIRGDENTIYSNVDSMLIEGDLRQEVKWVNIRNEYEKKRMKESAIKEKEKYGYIWLESNEFWDENDRFGLSPFIILVLRSDGTIIGRVHLGLNGDGVVEEIKEIILNDKKEIAQASLFSRNQLYGALGVLVVVILIVGVYYNNRIRKQKLQTRFSQLKLKAIRSQMNPHFIFNALTSIQSLILGGF